MDIDAAATAAKVRVMMHEASQSGGLNVRSRALYLNSLLSQADSVQKQMLYGHWARNAFVLSLDSAHSAVQMRIGADSPLLHPGHREHQREGCQAAIAKQIRVSHERAALVHIRRRLDRWQVPMLPGRRVDAWLRLAGNLSTLVAPRVLAARARTAFNGWATSRRFQGNGRCCLDCGGADSIEHYSRCPCFHRLSRQRFGLCQPTPENALAEFVGLIPAKTVNRRMAPDERAALRACAVYALMRTHGSVRAGLERSAGPEAFRGFAFEAVRGNQCAAGIVQRSLKRPLQS